MRSAERPTASLRRSRARTSPPPKPLPVTKESRDFRIMAKRWTRGWGSFPANKYGAKKVHTLEGDFDSQKEFKRYCDLHILLRAGEIRNLDRQVHFPLIPSQKGEFRAERAAEYIADFVYEEKRGGEWVKIVEDAKGVRTDTYKLKRKLMLYFHGISIKEV